MNADAGDGLMNMVTWFRVFGLSDVEPDLRQWIDAVPVLAFHGAVQFQKGERGWWRAEIQVPENRGSILVERFWRDEEGVREELQTWAAWLEICEGNPYRERLMQHMISTQQVFTVRPSDEVGGAMIESLCVPLCQFVAGATKGVYEVDGRGFFDAEGSLLVQE
jgi:hypothetical protein